eukprot:gene27390-747_t
MAVTAACNFKEQERVVARTTFESNNWILRSRQDRNIDRLDESHDVGVVVTWSPRAEEPWGQIKAQKNGTVHVRLEAVMSGKDKMDTGMVLKFHVTGDGTGRKKLPPTFSGHVLTINDVKGFSFIKPTDLGPDMKKGDRHQREHAVEVRLDPKGREMKFHELRGGAMIDADGKSGKGNKKGDAAPGKGKGIDIGGKAGKGDKKGEKGAYAYGAQ